MQAMNQQERLYTVEQYLRFRVRRGKQELLIKWKEFSADSWEPIHNIFCATEQQLSSIREAYHKKLSSYVQMGINEKEIQIIVPESSNYVKQQIKLDQKYKLKWKSTFKSSKRRQIKDLDYCEIDSLYPRKSKRIEKQFNEKKINKKGYKQLVSPKIHDPLHVQKKQKKQNKILPETVQRSIPKRIKLNFERENQQTLVKQTVEKDIRGNDGWIDEQIGEINEYVQEEQYKEPVELKHLKSLISQASALKRRLFTKNKGKCFELSFNEQCLQFPIIIHQKYIENFVPRLLASFYLKEAKKLK